MVNEVKKYMGFILLLVIVGGAVIYFMPAIFSALSGLAYMGYVILLISAILAVAVLFSFKNLFSGQGARN